MLMWYQPNPKTFPGICPRAIWIATAARSPSSALMPSGTRSSPTKRQRAAPRPLAFPDRTTASPAEASAKATRASATALLTAPDGVPRDREADDADQEGEDREAPRVERGDAVRDHRAGERRRRRRTRRR